ncbi:type IV pilus modification PilV family protein [Poriferisphaera corsica]|uniref:type IV pilus modification PilV family protein n=1 Tax=Poriferisphaera corsica TaxID=2528020 RepID=UPI0011A96F17|nr:hypothetical protein [Poriferisphaera corsica]
MKKQNIHPDIRKRHARNAGFTLIEAALTTVIVGTGVLAIVAAQQAYHKKNDWAARTGTAMLLANEIRELTLSLPFHDPITGDQNFGPEPNELKSDGLPNIKFLDDLDDFAGIMQSNNKGQGTVFSPPVNALRKTVPDMNLWAQYVTVEKVPEDNISSSVTLPMTTDSDIIRVTVDIAYTDPNNNQEEHVTSLSWIVTR